MGSENRSIINVSIHPDIKDEVNLILDELKKRCMPKSTVVCRLLKQFRDDGYVFKEGVSDD